jgi:hypothetical protein
MTYGHAPSRSRTYNLLARTRSEGVRVLDFSEGKTHARETVANAPCCQNRPEHATNVQPAEMGRLLRFPLERVDSNLARFLRDLSRGTSTDGGAA